MEHSFDIHVAEDVGVHAAVIFRSFCFWILHNEKNGTNYHDGKHWTYNSVQAMHDLFPYLTRNQIETAIKKLKAAGYIVTGNYNDQKWDRKLWYSFGETGIAFLKNQNCISEKTEMQTKKIRNAKTKNPEPIADIYTDNIPDNNTDVSISRTHARAPEYPQTVEDILKIAASPFCGMKCTQIQAEVYLANRKATDWEDAARRKIMPGNVPYDLKRWLIREQQLNNNNKTKDYSNGQNLSNNPADFEFSGEY